MKTEWFNITQRNAAAEVYVYDEIGAWGISAKDFVDELNALKGVEQINLRVNSPGGSVVDVLAMMTALQNHEAHVTAYVDGLAASSASRLILAADEVEMAENAFLMIHNVWVMMAGNAEALRAEAELLDKFDDGLANDYAKKSGQDIETIKEWMAKDTWFTAAEAEEAGFVDFIGAEQKAAACVSSRFKAVIRDLKNKPKGYNPEVAEEPFSEFVPQSNGPVAVTPEGENEEPKEDFQAGQENISDAPNDSKPTMQADIERRQTQRERETTT